jgi:transposase InsO family protein
LKVNVEQGQGMSLEQIRALLKVGDGLRFEGQNRAEVYGWVNQTLRQQHYQELERRGRGVVRLYVAKMTGMSRAQVTRLISQYLQGEPVQPKVYRRRRFPSVYTAADAALLAQVDEAHETLSGPATQKILQREWYEYGDQRYQRLARISVAQLYRLRQSRSYRQQRVRYEKTRPTPVAIGERRQPDPQGRPGFLRVDTVHQGDLDGEKGLYHINAVDEVTQWQVVGATAHISEAWLSPVLAAMLDQFPFHIRGFHSDNGGEFINHTVAALLNKLLVEQTKSRPRHSNDNGLVEAKNGAVIRKHIGYGYIASVHADAFQVFYQEHFNPYLNFHRPCGAPEIRTDPKGKQKRVYPWYATPWEMLRRLPGLPGYLKGDLTISDLDRQARVQSDTQAAMAMQKAKQELFAKIYRRKTA